MIKLLLSLTLLASLTTACGSSEEDNANGGFCNNDLLSDYNRVLTDAQSGNYLDASDSMEYFNSAHPEVNCRAEVNGEEITVDETRIKKLETAILLLNAFNQDSI